MKLPAVYRKDEPAGKSLPTRDQIAVADTWDLTPLYATAEAWQADFTKLQEDYPKIADFKGRIGASAQSLLEVLEFEKALNLAIERLYHYASLKCAEDSADSANLNREAQLQALLTKIGEASAFVSPEIQEISDETFATCLADPLLAGWEIPLQRLRRLKPHTLSDKEERLLALSATALRGHDETFSQLTDVDMKFGVIKDENGEERPLSHGAYSSFLVKRDPMLRKAAFHQYYAEYDDHKYTIASTLANSVRADVFRARARNYPSALENALFYDDVPVSVYDNLIATVRKNLPSLFRYYALRKKVLKLEELHQYDTYVPMVAQVQVRHTFDEAIEKVLESLSPLGSEYVNALADGMRHQRWCDRYESKGKRSGAFSSSSYRSIPYILMNYKEDVFSDVYTLTHEAGHSMHSWYCQRNQPYQTYDYPIFLAEVASTFNEELLTHHLLETTTDPAMRAYIINRQIDDIRGTVFRQTMFAEFEKRIHATEEAGEPLTLDTFRGIYRELLNAYFGPDFVIDDVLELECLRIPHFYSAFYVYKYSTGLSASLSLSQQVLEQGAPATEKYLGFLKSGGSKFPIPTLQAAGVDMSSPEPVEKALALFGKRVAELEELLG